MANATTEQRLMDGTHKAVVKLTGTTDGASGQIGGVVIDVSTLAQAKNANNILMTSNADPKSIYRVYVKKILADIYGGYVTLSWQDNTANNTMVTLGPGYREFDFEFIGGLITNPSSNSTGDIILNTTGFGANGAYTIVLELKKDGNDYVTGFPGA